MKKLFIAFLVFLLFPSTGFAKDISDIANLVKFFSPPILQNVDGLNITPSLPIGEAEYMFTKLDSKLYYTNGVGYVGVIGVQIKFTNTTSSVALVSWKDSVLMIDDVSYGIPLIAGMPYREAGNPSATPNTVIPPKKTVYVNTYVPSPILHNGAWYQQPIKIPKKGFVTFSYYISVNINNKSSYVNVDIPKIYISEESLSK